MFSNAFPPSTARRIRIEDRVLGFSGLAPIPEPASPPSITPPRAHWMTVLGVLVYDWPIRVGAMAADVFLFRLKMLRSLTLCVVRARE